jgi:hypothetical protein
VLLAEVGWLVEDCWSRLKSCSNSSAPLFITANILKLDGLFLGKEGDADAGYVLEGRVG